MIDQLLYALLVLSIGAFCLLGFVLSVAVIIGVGSLILTCIIQLGVWVFGTFKLISMNTKKWKD